MPASPNTLNYFIGKGIIKFTPAGGVQRDLGNAPEIEITPTIEKLDHFSSRSGVRKKDRTVVTEKGATIRIVLDEVTAENLALQLMGEVSTSTDGTKSFRIMSESEITGVIDFTGTNDVGNQVDMHLSNVSFGPSGSFNLISDEWGQIEITGDVLATEHTDGTSDFGLVTFTDAA
ncbi:phage tail tube protein [Rhizobium leguminosarum]